MKFKKIISFLVLLLFPASFSQAYWVWSPEQGKFINAEGQAQDAAEEQYDYAMKFFKEKDLDRAEEQLKDIVKKYPTSPSAPEAYYRLGTIYEEKADYIAAFKTYQKIVETYPQSDRFGEVIEREFRIGNLFLSGKKGKFAGLEILPSLPQAVKVFDHIVKFAPFSDFGDKAHFQLGLANKKWGHFGDAGVAFQAVIDQYPQSDLVSQARYQLAETSFLRSASEFRDQRALDDASKQVDRFLTRYPDSNAAEEAARLRQAIDEKNAEKNYRVGLYYEKDNYVESALIYYSDVAARYPATIWGQKAAEKLKTLKEPVKYLNDEERRLAEEEQALEAEFENIGEKDEVERGILERKLERVKKLRKALENSKSESMERREQDLARRQRELKGKFKNLEVKRKLLEKNPSEDLKRAIDRWHASLVEEQDGLLEESRQLKGWQEELGLSSGKFDLGFLPFLGDAPSELEKVRLIEAKKFYKLSETKKILLEEKEVLYKQYGEVAVILGRAPAAAELSAGPSTEQLEKIKAEISALEDEINTKESQYEKKFGRSSLDSVRRAVHGSVTRSLGFVNPFDGRSSAADASPEQALLEKRMHLQEKMAAQQNLVQTLSEAFEAQIKLQEHKRLLSRLEDEKPDPRELRKTIRAMERAIRSGYQEIEDRHKKKGDLLEELDQELKQREGKDPALIQAGRMVASPATGTARFFHAFLFGLPHKDVTLTEKAGKLETAPDTAVIKKLEEEIRYESLLIEAKNREILGRQKELEVMKAQASLAGGYKFRPVFLDAPYLFLDEAVESARRVIPKKQREEVLINRLNEETEKKESIQKELEALEVELAGRKIVPSEKKPEIPEAVAPPDKAAEDALKREIEDLSRRLEEREQAYKAERAARPGKSGIPFLGIGKTSDPSKKNAKLEKEFQEIEDSLIRLIRRETDLESEEFQILEKRITHIDKALPRVNSKILSQDLLTERARMEERLAQLESRRDFLTKEMERFEPMETRGAAA